MLQLSYIHGNMAETLIDTSEDCLRKGKMCWLLNGKDNGGSQFDRPTEVSIFYYGSLSYLLEY